ncbi:hypothetical protein [Methylobacterium flocculans]|uniref:hypothetical protein n=1 Tax=Methylobacterium flocculans TaxID=2984843 RepID=UPI0021F328E5|nr:hypothetical protein [Methylobacterium sp. FF17]
MTITTKAALADELGVTRARVSQYVKAGLPVRSDGKLERDEALNWLNRNVVGLNREQDRGVNRAARLAKPTKAKPKSPPEPEPFAPEDLVRAIVVAMIHRMDAVTAFAVIAAGGSAETAYAAASIARSEMMQAGGDVAMAWGVPDGFDGPLGQVEATPFPPNWPALAAIAGEPPDLGQWREAETRRPYWQDPEPAEPPHPWDVTP